MLKKLMNFLFWKKIFSDTWDREFGVYPQNHDFDWEKLKKQKYFWQQERGRQRQFPPRHAAYMAFREMCNEFYFDKKNKGTIEKYQDILENAAEQLGSLARRSELRSPLQKEEDFLDSPWNDYLRTYWDKWERSEEKRRNEAKEIQSYRFDIEKIDEAYQCFLSGNIGEVPKRIWRASYPQKTAHLIALEADVSIEDFVFWMCVFRKFLEYKEDTLSRRHMYCRDSRYEELEDAIDRIGQYNNPE